MTIAISISFDYAESYAHLPSPGSLSLESMLIESEVGEDISRFNVKSRARRKKPRKHRENAHLIHFRVSQQNLFINVVFQVKSGKSYVFIL